MNKLVYKVSSTLLELAYNDGVSKGIINDTNLTKEDFLNLCKSSLFPAYLEFSKENSGV